MYHKIFLPESDWHKITRNEFCGKLHACWCSDTYGTSEVIPSTSDNATPHEVLNPLVSLTYVLFCVEDQI